MAALVQVLLQPFGITCLTLLALFQKLAYGFTGSTYALDTEYSGANFFDGWDFFTDAADPYGGFVTYLGHEAAVYSNLINASSVGPAYMGVDSVSILPVSTAGQMLGAGRPSVRISTQLSWTHGLFIGDFAHAPAGICGTWPSFFTLGPDSPSTGEVDIMDGVNQQISNDVALHTTNTCMVDGSLQSGTQDSTDCSNASQGCEVTDTSPFSYSQFNSNGGGVFAMQWTSEYIRVWFFPRSSIPNDITIGQPNPSLWGTPVANMMGSCSIDQNFQQNKIIFDTNFCGTNAGTASAWSSTCASFTGNSTCNYFVGKNPQAFQNAYWSINSVRVYQLVNPALPSPSPQYIASAQPPSPLDQRPTPAAVLPVTPSTILCPQYNFTAILRGTDTFEVECSYRIPGTYLAPLPYATFNSFEDCLRGCLNINQFQAAFECGAAYWNIANSTCTLLSTTTGPPVYDPNFNMLRAIYYAYPLITDNPISQTASSTSAFVLIVPTPESYSPAVSTTSSTTATTTPLLSTTPSIQITTPIISTTTPAAPTTTPISLITTSGTASLNELFVTITESTSGPFIGYDTTTVALPSGTAPGTVELIPTGTGLFVTVTELTSGPFNSYDTATVALPTGTVPGTIELIPAGTGLFVTITETNSGPFNGYDATTVALPSGTAPGTVELIPTGTGLFVTITETTSGPFIGYDTTTVALPSGTAPGTVELIPTGTGLFVTITETTSGPFIGYDTTTVALPSGTTLGTVELVPTGAGVFVTITGPTTGPFNGYSTTTLALPTGTVPGTVEIVPTGSGLFVTITGSTSGPFNGYSTSTLALPVGTVPGTVELLPSGTGLYITITGTTTGPFDSYGTTTLALPTGTAPGTIELIPSGTGLYVTITGPTTGPFNGYSTTTLALPTGTAPGTVELLPVGSGLFVTITSTTTGAFNGYGTTTLALPTGTVPGTVELLPTGTGLFITITESTTGPVDGYETTTVAFPSGTAPGTIELIPTVLPAGSFVTITETTSGPFSGYSTTIIALPTGAAPGTVELIPTGSYQTTGSYVTITETTSGPFAGYSTTTVALPSGAIPGTVELIPTPGSYVTITEATSGPFAGYSTLTAALPSGTTLGTIELIPTSGSYVTITEATSGPFAGYSTLTAALPTGTIPGTVELIPTPGSYVTITGTTSGPFGGYSTTTIALPIGTTPGTVELVPTSGSYVTITETTTGAFGGYSTTTIALPSGTILGTIELIPTSGSYVTITGTTSGPFNGYSTSTIALPSDVLPGTVELVPTGAGIFVTITKTTFGPFNGYSTTTIALPTSTTPGTVELLPILDSSATSNSGTGVYVTITGTTAGPFGGYGTSTIALPIGALPGTVELVPTGTGTFVTITETTSGTFAGYSTSTVALPVGTTPGSIELVPTPGLGTPSNSGTGVYVTITGITTGPFGGYGTSTVALPTGTVPGTIELVPTGTGSYVTVTGTTSGTFAGYSTSTVALPVGTTPGTIELLPTLGSAASSVIPSTSFTITTATDISSPPSSLASTTAIMANVPARPSYIASFRDIGCQQFNQSTNNGFELMGTSPAMTLEQCVGICGNSFYAGVHQSDCYCANTAFAGQYLVPEPDDVCNTPCPGNSNEMCGGNYLVDPTLIRLNMFSNTPDVGSFKNIGCQELNQSANIGFVLVNSSPVMTINLCVSMCSNSYYVGVHDTDCYCANTVYAGQMLVPEPNYYADIPCPGNSNEACGGDGKNYGIVDPELVLLSVLYNTFTDIGEYRNIGTQELNESTSNGFALVGTSPEMTLNLCVSMCDNSYYVGVHNTDCYCADEVDAILAGQNLVPEPDSYSNIPCPGNPNQMCGGNGIDESILGPDLILLNLFYDAAILPASIITSSATPGSTTTVSSMTTSPTSASVTASITGTSMNTATGTNTGSVIYSATGTNTVTLTSIVTSWYDYCQTCPGYQTAMTTTITVACSDTGSNQAPPTAITVPMMTTTMECDCGIGGAPSSTVYTVPCTSQIAVMTAAAQAQAQAQAQSQVQSSAQGQGQAEADTQSQAQAQGQAQDQDQADAQPHVPILLTAGNLPVNTPLYPSNSSSLPIAPTGGNSTWPATQPTTVGPIRSGGVVLPTSFTGDAASARGSHTGIVFLFSAAFVIEIALALFGLV